MAGFTLRHFSPVEFRCKCGCGAGMEKMDADLLHLLDEARDLAGTPVFADVRLPLPQAQQGRRGRAHVRPHARVCRGHPLCGFPFPFRDPSSVA